jgi:hypothetical protein
MFSPNIWKHVPNHQVHIPGLINDFISGDIMEYLILDIMVIASCYFTMGLSLHIVPSSHNCGADGELVA